MMPHRIFRYGFRVGCVLFVGAITLLWRDSARAQHGGGSLAPLQSIVDSLSAPPGYTREVFTYPRFGRLDPIVPPATITSRDAFPQISLSGILYDVESPEKSAAIVRIAGRTPERRVISAGDTIDQYRIVRIERHRVVVDVQLLGITRRIYLEKSRSRAN